MDTREIIETLKNYYWTKSYVGLDGEDDKPELDSHENCAFFAILKTLSKEQLEEASDMLYDHLIPLTFMVHRTLSPDNYNVFTKNDSMSNLLKRFEDKKSKRVVESRKEILRRYPYQDYSVQKKIIKSFLSSDCVSGREWAAIEADRRWDKSFVDSIKSAYEKKATDKVAITYIRHLPIEYVKAKEESLVMLSRTEFCIRMGDNADQYIHKYDLSIFEHLYVKARIGKKPDLTDIQVERRFFRHIYIFSQKVLMRVDGDYDSISQIPWLRRALWALGELGYRELLMKYLAFNKWVVDSFVYDSKIPLFSYVQQWIADNYFPNIPISKSIDWNKILDKIATIPHPRSIKIDSLKDLDEYDDLPPNVIETLSDFM